MTELLDQTKLDDLSEELSDEALDHPDFAAGRCGLSGKG
jgi:hypothetical protein